MADPAALHAAGATLFGNDLNMRYPAILNSAGNEKGSAHSQSREGGVTFIRPDIENLDYPAMCVSKHCVQELNGPHTFKGMFVRWNRIVAAKLFVYTPEPPLRFQSAINPLLEDLKKLFTRILSPYCLGKDARETIALVPGIQVAKCVASYDPAAFQIILVKRPAGIDTVQHDRVVLGSVCGHFHAILCFYETWIPIKNRNRIVAQARQVVAPQSTTVSVHTQFVAESYCGFE